MKGDFTRNTFEPKNHFARVLMQQGRVQLDADWNEQTAILLHYLRTLAADIIGPHGGPEDSFLVGQREDESGNLISYDFVVSPGNYYVDGILCENEAPLAYTDQPDYPLGEDEQLKSGDHHLVYLDVWERHVTHIQKEWIREVALGGPDTASRSQVVWQIKTAQVGKNTKCENLNWEGLVGDWQPENRGQLKAQAKITEDLNTEDPCITPPDSQYRGAENQPYRVEIHTGGNAWNGEVVDGEPAGNAMDAATFKWSRENGSVTFPILELSGSEATLEHLGRDERFSLQPGDWVEVVDDFVELRGEPGSLFKVQSVDRERMKVALEVPPGKTPPYFDEKSSTHPLLRRWDYRALDPSSGYPAQANDGALLVQEGKELLLEDGIQITFEPTPSGKTHTYPTGDYWLIPARTSTGDVEWPGSEGNPLSVPPHGVEHHYAPLAVISVGDAGIILEKTIHDCRCTFQSICQTSWGEKTEGS